jgi:hypothetical protein
MVSLSEGHARRNVALRGFFDLFFVVDLLPRGKGHEEKRCAQGFFRYMLTDDL